MDEMYLKVDLTSNRTELCSTVQIGLGTGQMVQDLSCPVNLCGTYDLYMVTMDLTVSYGLKSGFADDPVQI
jgi:hypothetical protein